MHKYYLNHASAGLMSDETLKAVTEHLKLESEIGANPAALARSEELERFYTLAAGLLNAKSPQEIAFTDSAARGWSLVLWGAGMRRGDVIVTLSSEYGSNLISLYDIAFRTGGDVILIPCGEDGSFSMAELEHALEQGVAQGGKLFLAVSHAASQGSIINPVEELGRLAQKHHAVYLVDGAQAVGQIPVDVQKIGCSAYTASGRKWLRGPKGTAILYVKKDADVSPLQLDVSSARLLLGADGSGCGVEVRGDARRFELWERNNAAILGLNNALREVEEIGIGKINQVLSQRADRLRQCISDNSALSLVGKSVSKSGTAAFYLKNAAGEEAAAKLFEDAGLTIKLVGQQDFPCFFRDGAVRRIFRLSPHYVAAEESLELAESVIGNIR